jgi:8-oxo-dGTP pyrophosphatase MutT (NUDIX family)
MHSLFSWMRPNWTKREFYETQEMPDDNSCISASWVFFYDKKVILVQNKRGWEIPWWHREFWESIEDTLIREMKEEIGIDLMREKNYKMWWYRKVTSDKELPDRNGGIYPFPNYLITYIGQISNPPVQPQWDDVVSMWFFSYDDIKNWSLIARDIILYAFEQILNSNTNHLK